ncbi:MAG: DUF4087 domain-containing protein [Methylocystis sp.]
MKRLCSFRAFLLAFALAAAGSPAFAANEKRCGWIVNPTPGNWSLIDPEGEWELGAQGGHQAYGMDNLPDFTTREWVKTNGDYGYGCACLTVHTDPNAMRVKKVINAVQKPLKLCEADKKLKKPQE